MKAYEIIKLLNNWMHSYLIDNWDNTGFQIGNPNKEVKKILISLDLNEQVFEQAKLKKVDMIITHHPILFKPINRLTTDNLKGKLICDIIKKDIVVFNGHSNLDVCCGGVNDALSSLLGLKDIQILSECFEEKLYKLVIYVPTSYSEKIRDVLGKSKAGWIGNYSHCTFNLKGMGTFMPREGTSPFIGKKDILEKVEETRIETIVKEKQLDEVLNNVLRVHPYEEVAYDIYPLRNSGIKYGYGRVGNIKEMPFDKFIDIVKKKLNVESIRVYGKDKQTIKRVAVCGGSGSDFIKDAYNKKADVYITGDIKFHDAQFAYQLGLPLIDANHYDTEKIILPIIQEYINTKINQNIKTYVLELNTAPYKVY